VPLGRVIRTALYANARRLTPSLVESAYRSAFAGGTFLDSRSLFEHEREINGSHVMSVIYTNWLQLILLCRKRKLYYANIT